MKRIELLTNWGGSEEDLKKRQVTISKAESVGATRVRALTFRDKEK